MEKDGGVRASHCSHAFSAHMLDIHILPACACCLARRPTPIDEASPSSRVCPAVLHAEGPARLPSITNARRFAPSSPAASIVVFSFPLSPHFYSLQTSPILFPHLIKPSRTLCQTSLISSSTPRTLHIHASLSPPAKRHHSLTPRTSQTNTHQSSTWAR